MKMIEVQERTTKLIEQLVDVWEQSVKATHLFLSDEEIAQIKTYVPEAMREIAHLIIAVNEDGIPAGFMGVEDGKLEMLFIAPDERGKGVGKQFIQYAVEKLFVNEVTVNEQNPQAIGFYEHMGFRVYKRTDVDEQGGPYPLLYMRLENDLS